MKRLFIKLLIIGVVLVSSSSCDKDNEDISINSVDKAKEVVGEINYLVRNHFPSRSKSWQLSNVSFSGGVSGTALVDGSFSHYFNEGWSTYSSSDTYNDVYVELDNYQARSSYNLKVTGSFSMSGSISQRGTIGGSSSTSGKHILYGVFSITGKYEGSDLEVYAEFYNDYGVDYSAVLVVGDTEWQIN